MVVWLGRDRAQLRLRYPAFRAPSFNHPTSHFDPDLSSYRLCRTTNIYHGRTLAALMSKVRQLPRRSQVKTADTWDLSSLFADDQAWEAQFKDWEFQISGYDAFRGKLGQDAKTLAACLRSDNDFERKGERLGTYAFLKTAEDAANSDYQRMIGRFRHASSRA